MLYFMGCMFFSNFSCQPYVINIQLRNTNNICTDLYILLKPQSELGYLGTNGSDWLSANHRQPKSHCCLNVFSKVFAVLLLL